MKINPKPCEDCPFKKTSIAGFLADYTLQDFQMFGMQDFPFPCHATVPKHGCSVDEATEMVANDEVHVCRGYAESMVKSAKSPYRNPDLVEACNKVREEGTSDETMTSWEFHEHHTPKF